MCVVLIKTFVGLNEGFAHKTVILNFCFQLPILFVIDMHICKQTKSFIGSINISHAQVTINSMKQEMWQCCIWNVKKDVHQKVLLLRAKQFEPTRNNEQKKKMVATFRDLEAVTFDHKINSKLKRNQNFRIASQNVRIL